MKRSRPVAWVGLVYAVLAAHASWAAGGNSVRCGSTAFAITGDHPIHAASRRIVMNSISVTGRNAVDLGQWDAKGDRFAAEVTGWQCLRGQHMYVLVLGMSCVSDDASGCGGHQEWTHLIGPDGRLLDAGFTPADARFPALLRKLGISRQMRAGVALHEVAP